MTRRRAGGLLATLLLVAGMATAAEPDRAFLARLGEPVPAAVYTPVFGLPGADLPAATLIQFVSCENQRCEASLRAIQEFIATPLRQEDIRVAAVAVGATEADTAALARRLSLAFPVHADPNMEVFASVAEDGLPRTLIVDETGRVVYQHAGYGDYPREAEFRAVMEALVAGEPVPEALVRGGSAAGPPPGSGLFNPEIGAVDLRGKRAPDVPVEQWVTPPPADTEGKFLLVDFWATWCGPCRQTLEMADPLHRQFADRLVTLAVSDEPVETVRRYVREAGLEQPIGTDTKGRAIKHLEIRGIPNAFLANPDGIVVWQGHPMLLWRNDAALLREYLAE